MTGPINPGRPATVNNYSSSQTDRVADKAKVQSETAGKLGGNPNAQNAKGANVQISNSAKHRAEEYKKAYDIASNTPDIRNDRVAELKAKIQNGTYKPDAGKIADGMMREAIRDHLAIMD